MDERRAIKDLVILCAYWLRPIHR